MEGTIKQILKQLKANEQTVSMFLGGLVMLVIAMLVISYFREAPRSRLTQESSSTSSAQVVEISPATTPEPLANVNSDLQLTGSPTLPEPSPTPMPTNITVPPVPTIPPTTTSTTYTVKAGDNLWKIAQTHYGSGYNWVDIAKANNLTNANQIEVGQQLTFPQVTAKQATTTMQQQTTTVVNRIQGTSYTVAKGDTLWSIAVRAYADGYQWSKIWHANEQLISHPNIIEVGQHLTIPRT